MNRKQFAKYLARDQHCPCGCLGREDTYIPQHRANRGIGGSKALDRPANIIVLCSEVNGLIESNADLAQQARAYGWKLQRWQIPEETAIYDRATCEWSILDNDFGRIIQERKAA
ncbi:hypothetical protein [Glutamicibacter sp. NPDC127525]|uniref:hypothetical protein n=1 Tax=unclassified Glutamicibacter TaxID=2627139 RepID=UPI00363AFDC2